LVKPKLYPSAQDFVKVKKSQPYFTIAPASIWYTKQFPEERWIALINALNESFDVYLLGGKADIPRCQNIQKKSNHKKVKVLAGQLSFLESAALMHGAKMNYVNDSAPLHLASAMDAPVTAIFCSTVPQFGFGPLSTQSKVVETHHQLDCRPCGLHGKTACPKGHFKCADIEVEAVLDFR